MGESFIIDRLTKHYNDKGPLVDEAGYAPQTHAAYSPRRAGKATPSITTRKLQMMWPLPVDPDGDWDEIDEASNAFENLLEAANSRDPEVKTAGELLDQLLSEYQESIDEADETLRDNALEIVQLKAGLKEALEANEKLEDEREEERRRRIVDTLGAMSRLLRAQSERDKARGIATEALEMVHRLIQERDMHRELKEAYLRLLYPTWFPAGVS